PHCASSHRAPPSFPTRRSSDLQGGRHLADHPHRPDLRQCQPRLSAPILLELTAPGNLSGNLHELNPTTAWQFEVGTRGTIGLRVDRKSTRLNSSHEWISYAVFC